MARQAVLLIGSPRWLRSTSYSLGAYLIEKLEDFDCETIHIHKAIADSRMTQDMVRSVNAADLIILSAPLYVDALPAPVLRAFELIASARGGKPDRPQQFVAILNCGFPETKHNNTAMRICKLFAERVGLTWAGGLAMGMGPAIDGRPLAKAGRVGKNARDALSLAADALSKGRPVPEEAIKRMAEPPMPIRLYTMIGNRTWKKIASRYGMADQLKARPFATAE
ncbi:MAG: hypothetical protein ACTSPE_12010 [Candidatus Thorarchaeota archaeon]